jgi:N-acetylglucosaminyldiphosphoundecaprenol N-acetyl-beta-D-mannosaminyltransferase
LNVVKNTEVILGVPFEAITFDEAVLKLKGFLDEPGNHVCFTPNPEMVMAAQKDGEFMAVLNGADAVLPDGVGVVMASFFHGRKIRRRVGGCDVAQALFGAVERPVTVYFLGGEPGVCEAAKYNVEKKYKNISVTGFKDGYFDAEKEKIIIEEIRRVKPDVLLVGIGFPRQEKWIARHKDELPVRLSMGVGGTIDVLAGTVRRAPKIFRLLGAEWLYRLIRQPSRYRRMARLPVFLVHAICAGLRGTDAAK